MQRSFLTATLISGLACCSLLAQSDLQAEIPFEFHVGQTLMPAGKYLVKQGPVGVITLRNIERPKAVMAHTMPAAAVTLMGDAGLRFNRYGDSYFLAKIWTPGTDSTRAVFTSKKERDLLIGTNNVQTAGVRLRRQ